MRAGFYVGLEPSTRALTRGGIQASTDAEQVPWHDFRPERYLFVGKLPSGRTRRSCADVAEADVFQSPR